MDEEDYEKLGTLTTGLSGAEIVNFVRAVMIKSVGKEIGINELKFIIKNFQPTVSKSMMASYMKFLEKFGEKE